MDNSRFEPIPTAQQPLLSDIPKLVDGEPVYLTTEEQISELVAKAVVQNPGFEKLSQEERASILVGIAQSEYKELTLEDLSLALIASSQQILPGFEA